MSKPQTHHSGRNPDRNRPRSWALAILAIVAWALLASNVADAQEPQVAQQIQRASRSRVPEYVLAQVLGGSLAQPTAPSSASSTVPSTEAPVPAEAHGARVQLVAQRMRADFQDQLVAGVSRPTVELEVHFDFDSDRIHDESEPQIEAAAQVLNAHFPETRFRVAGFTDPAGPEQYNQQLSERRASAVWQKLVEQHGVAPDRLERVGFGEADPAAPASDAQRRRVELQILRGEADRP